MNYKYSPPRPLSLLTQRGGARNLEIGYTTAYYVFLIPPLYRAKRKEIARWAILAKEPACRVERGLGGEFVIT